METKTTPNNYRIDLLLFQVLKLWLRTKKQILDRFGLTYSQFEIMAAIYALRHSKQEIIQVDLSEKTGIDPMTTSTVVRNLEKKQIITRKRGDVNTRVIFVELRHKGIELYEEAFREILKRNESLYNKVNNQLFSSQLLIISKELNKLNN